jgi:hypothetical protein
MRPRARTFTLLLLGAVLVAGAGCSKATPARSAYLDQLLASRHEKDTYFRTDPQGPLTSAQRAGFRGLRYFAPDTTFVFEGPIEKAASSDTVRFLTSKRTVEPYLRFGVFRFQRGGRDYALTVFLNLREPELFVPFNDETNGGSTYDAGRYINPSKIAPGRYGIDFNHAYNPYCAYNADWICPMPPSENHLPLRVEAGEKKYPHAGN